MFTDAELGAYLDEGLDPVAMSEIETTLRADASLLERLTAIIQRRDAGVHSLAAIWRRERISCPTREALGNHLLGVLEESESRFIRLHIEQLGCRICRANLEDLDRRRQEALEASQQRRNKYFQSSAGLLQR